MVSAAPDNKQVKSWVEQCKAGDRQAFTHLFYSFNRRVYYFALSLLRNENEAEEVVQEIFVKIWESRHQLDEAYSFSSFLFTVTKNHILNRLRRKAHEQHYQDYCRKTFSDFGNFTDNEVEYREMQRLVKEAVATLSPRKQEIFILSREGRLTYREIAAKLNISVKTVENQMIFALKQLRVRLLA